MVNLILVSNMKSIRQLHAINKPKNASIESECHVFIDLA